MNIMNIGALSGLSRRAEGPQLDLPDHWLSSEAKNLIERMVVKAPS